MSKSHVEQAVEECMAVPNNRVLLLDGWVHLRRTIVELARKYGTTAQVLAHKREIRFANGSRLYVWPWHHKDRQWVQAMELGAVVVGPRITINEADEALLRTRLRLAVAQEADHLVYTVVG